jgi:hypothetical protein
MNPMQIIPFTFDVPCDASLCTTPARWALTSHVGVMGEFYKLCPGHVRSLAEAIQKIPELDPGFDAHTCLGLVVQSVSDGLLTAKQVIDAFKVAGLAIDFAEELLQPGETESPAKYFPSTTSILGAVHIETGDLTTSADFREAYGDRETEPIDSAEPPKSYPCRKGCARSFRTIPGREKHEAACQRAKSS